MCKCCFGMLALLFLLVWLGYLPQAREVCGGPVIACGRVSQIEEKDGPSGQICLSLRSVTFCSGTNPNQYNQLQNNQTEHNRTGQQERQFAEGILCHLAQGEEMPRYGEWIVVSGMAECFDRQRNPGGFDAESYYRARGSVFLLKDGAVLERSGSGNRYRQMLFCCRRYLTGKLEEICGPDSGIMQAVLLGNKAALAAEVKAQYQKAGISHILAISGLHISFLGMGLYRMLRKCLPVPAAGAVAGSLLVSYVLMTGDSPSAFRAAVMCLLGLLADALGRSFDRLTALSVSALLLAAGRPLLLQQSGFLLSYGAILGLELLYPILSRLWTNRVTRLFLAGFSISFLTLPVVLRSFFSFPVYSFLLNLLVVPLMGLVMALGLLSLLAGLLFPSLGKLLFWPVHIVLLLFEAGCAVTQKLPGNTWLTGTPGQMQIVMYYILLAVFCLLKRYMTKPCALMFLTGALWILTGPARVGDTVIMLDVGQGDSILFGSEDGSHVLIDCGSSSERKLSEYTLLPCLKSQGIGRLDYVFLTHMDADHISGVKELLQDEGDREVSIGTLVLPALASPDAEYDSMVSLARQAGIRVCTMSAGERIQAGGFSFFCLHPCKEEYYADRNDASLVLYVKKQGFSALLTGDLDGEAEEAFVRRMESEETLSNRPGYVTVLKAGHHGSKASCGEGLLTLCRPSLTLVSCGEHNSYGHPDDKTLARIRASGSRVCVTKDTGAVRLWLWRGRVRIFCYGNESLCEQCPNEGK